MLLLLVNKNVRVLMLRVDGLVVMEMWKLGMIGGGGFLLMI